MTKIKERIDQLSQQAARAYRQATKHAKRAQSLEAQAEALVIKLKAKEMRDEVQSVQEEG